MAKLVLQGAEANVHLTPEEEEGMWIATCIAHRLNSSCGWAKAYDTLNDAVEYAEAHADCGDPR